MGERGGRGRERGILGKVESKKGEVRGEGEVDQYSV